MYNSQIQMSQCIGFPTMWYVGLKYPMSNKLLTEQHLQFLCLKGGCTGWSESTLVKMAHCWKSNALAQMKPDIK